ncbi:unnamed protein product [Pleuronectes platessa]|uniref:Uncharacterized protein n=1 Tax=Pleuronectes platessa TaxID=8262 RepID=A0A9N7V0S8_PLEPL|nr:unnamed protein product [Pleuronectes platessa]
MLQRVSTPSGLGHMGFSTLNITARSWESPGSSGSLVRGHVDTRREGDEMSDGGFPPVQRTRTMGSSGCSRGSGGEEDERYQLTGWRGGTGEHRDRIREVKDELMSGLV